MTDKFYQGIIAILLLLLACTVWMLAHPQAVTQVTQQQTPFQWYCPEKVPVNCSEQQVQVRLVEIPYDQLYTNGSWSYNVDTATPTPTLTPLATPEFPFLPIR